MGYIKDIEITCEVFENVSEIKKVLENNQFHYVEEFTLYDTYMASKSTNNLHN